MKNPKLMVPFHIAGHLWIWYGNQLTWSPSTLTTNSRYVNLCLRRILTSYHILLSSSTFTCVHVCVHVYTCTQVDRYCTCMQACYSDKKIGVKEGREITFKAGLIIKDIGYMCMYMYLCLQLSELFCYLAVSYAQLDPSHLISSLK